MSLLMSEENVSGKATVREVAKPVEDVFEEGGEPPKEEKKTLPVFDRALKALEGKDENHSKKAKKGKLKTVKKDGKLMEEQKDDETEMVKPKKEYHDTEIPVSDEQENVEDDETQIVRPKHQKPFTVPIAGELEKREETLIYRPYKKEAALGANKKPARERVVEEEEEDSSADESALDKEEGIHEEDVVETDEETDESGFEDWDDDAFDVDPDAEDAPEKIKAHIMAKAKEHGVMEKNTAVALTFLEDPKNNIVFIGRKKSIYAKYGLEGALHVGRVEEETHQGKNVYLDSLNPHVVFVCGARGSGKCLVGDTLITLENGDVIPIKELENRSEKVLALNHDFKINQAEKMGFFKRTVSRTLKLTFDSGKVIELTPEHPLLTLNGWKPAQELIKGSRIAAPRILPAFGNAVMKACDVKLLSYLIAEGHLDNQFVLFSNFDKKIVSEFNESVNEFDSGLRIEMHSKPGCFRIAQKKKKVDISHIARNEKGQFTDDSFIIAQKSSIMQWLESIGLYGKLSADKFIPKEIMRLNKEQLSLFLNRLFSCDGSIYRVNKGKTWAVSIGFSSEVMTRQVQHLLLRFGINSRFRKKKTRCNGKMFDNYETTLYGEDVLSYIKEIGFYGEKEEKMMKALTEMALLKRNPNVDTIPKEIWEQFKVGNWKQLARQLGYAPQSFHNTKNYAPSREKLLKMALLEQNKGVQLLAQSDIFWDGVKKIEEINCETEVYDISVPELHNFVANDIIVHNSYVLGVVAEELAKKNRNVGVVVVDPVGVFWSMKFPNREKKELESMAEWNLTPEGLGNLKVFIPEGIAGEVPRNTYDYKFSMLPSLLTSEDWCLTFGIERFSVTGLLLEKALKKVENGYKTLDSEEEPSRKIEGKKKKYGLDDVISCLEDDSEINSRDKGYKQDSVRALVSRFDAAKSWGIFNAKGTPLSELSREGQLTVLDTSFLDDNVTALIIGILARRLLAARKVSTRNEASQKFKTKDMDQLLEMEVPPTWLFIDEAHTLIPSGNVKTPASMALIEYVKQGRRPGLSLCFATQQPSAIDTKVLSQLDVIMSHKLIFDDDIKAIYKRTPTIIPHKYKVPNFLKTLPVGVALTGDRAEETSRAFVMKIRPRLSQHEGRDAETNQNSEKMEQEQIDQLALDMIRAKVNSEGMVELEKLEALVHTLNTKYQGNAQLKDILAKLEKEGFKIDKESNSLVSKTHKKEKLKPIATAVEEMANELEEEELSHEERVVSGHTNERVSGMKEAAAKELGKMEETDLVGFAAIWPEARARQVVDDVRKKKMLGLLGAEEKVSSFDLKYRTVWKVDFHEYNPRNEFVNFIAYVDSVTGEFLHFNNQFLQSTGLKRLFELSDEELHVVLELVFENKVKEESESKFKRVAEKLVEKGILGKKVSDGKTRFSFQHPFDLPNSPKNLTKVGSLSQLSLTSLPSLGKEREHVNKEQVQHILGHLWPNVVVKRVEAIYRPVYQATLQSAGGERVVRVDGITGRILAE